MRVDQRGGRTRLPLEPTPSGGIMAVIRGRKDFDRYGPSETRIARLIDVSHTASAQRCDDGVTGRDGSRREPRAGAVLQRVR